jgi:hypothetical protein
LAATLAGGLCPRAEAGPFEAPVLSNPATGLHLVGKLVWLDLETTDLPGAKTFYRGLFGWNYRDYHAYGVDYLSCLCAIRPGNHLTPTGRVIPPRAAYHCGQWQANLTRTAVGRRMTMF